MRKPLIGVVPLYDAEKESYWMLPGYMKGIEEAGGIPVMLPLTIDEDVIVSLAHTYDGFLFTGGHDVNPALYGEEMASVCGEICMERDEMEAILFKQVIELNKPAFGICRGLQLFNVLLGGTLYQDIPTQLHTDELVIHKQNPPYDHPVHIVHIDDNSMLHKLVNKQKMMVNSYHHQGVKQLLDQLSAVAKAVDGLIEAACMLDKHFVLAVQWHPEFNYKLDEDNFKLFAAFVKASKTAAVQ